VTTSARSVLVTGGSSGIGRATAELFLAQGAQVAICARRADRLEATAKVLGNERVFALPADLAHPTQATHAVRQAAEAMGGLDVVVNAHGIIGNPGKLEDLSATEWQSVLNTNLMGPVAVTTAAIPYLRESRGSVVNVSSINAIQAEPWVAPYGVSKAALVGFTKYAAIELAPYGIRVNAVLPGWVDTPMAQPFFEEAGVVGKRLETNMMGRPAEPAEIASVIGFLASKQASFLTGECVIADGGHWTKMAALAVRPDE
jgi:meso-butanediol dehydrogenase / (S,S)-butanediol dehydrogenase / diacetyl reductase